MADSEKHIDKTVAAAQKLFKGDQEHWSEPYKSAKEDLFFQSDDPMAQWEAADHKSRTDSSRPALTIDMLSQFVHQTVNDTRMNTPTINILPSGGGATVDKAEKYKGIIRDIEYKSNADDAYDNAVNYSVKCSIGFIRVDHAYVNDTDFNQHLLIKRVVNPLAVYIDANSVESDGSDAKHCTIIDQMSVASFKRKYPGFEPSSFEEMETRDEDYKDDEKITIAEQFTIIEEKSHIATDEDGNYVEYNEAEKDTYAKTRPVKKIIVQRRLMSGMNVLEETTFPGKYIPLVPVYGEEAWIDGKRRIFSLIRKSKGSQQMFNYWKSLETEILMKQPNAPVMVAAGSVEDYSDDWQHPEKSMALRYDHMDDDGNPYPTPIRLQPPTIPTGIVNASRETVDDIKATMGIYNAALGAKSNETSGVAINQRKIEGDVAVYHFSDNLIKSITHVGRILVSAIPEIYDTKRVLRIIGEEDEPGEIGINGALVEGQEETLRLDDGEYDVKVIAGAAFTTRRQETVTAMTELFSKNPELFAIMGDLYFKNSDFTGAQALAKRMEKAIDPKYLEDDEDSEEGQQLAQMQAQFEEIIQAMQQELQAAQQQLESKQGELEVKAMGEQNKSDAAAAQNQIKDAELQLKDAEISLKEAQLQAETELKHRELDLKELEITGKISVEQDKADDSYEIDTDKNDIAHEKIHLDTMTEHRALDQQHEQSEKQLAQSAADTQAQQVAASTDQGEQK